MSKRVRVNVTARDIRLGVASDAGSCPIARAVKRIKRFQDYDTEKIEVTAFEVILPGENPWDMDSISLPRQATYFVLLFDGGSAVDENDNLLAYEDIVKPFRFTLEVDA